MNTTTELFPITFEPKHNRKVAITAPGATEPTRAAKALGIRGLRPIASVLGIPQYSYMDLATLAYAISHRLQTNALSRLNGFRTDELCDFLRIANGEVYANHRKSQLIVELAFALT